GVRVDGDEMRPRWRLAGQARRGIPEARIHAAPAERTEAPIGHRVAIRRLVQASHAADVARVHEHVPHRRIDRHAAEVRTALLSGEENPEFLRAVRRVRPEVVYAADLLDEIAAEFFMIGLA